MDLSRIFVAVRTAAALKNVFWTFLGFILDFLAWTFFLKLSRYFEFLIALRSRNCVVCDLVDLNLTTSKIITLIVLKFETRLQTLT